MSRPKNKKELISVIVPVYNAEATLEKCVNSILKQSYINLEIIIVNDGSTDNSLKICKNYQLKDKRIRLINKNNEGLSTSKNIALKIAKGDYVTFVDSDDWIDPQMYKNMLAELKEYNADISICRICQVYKNIKVGNCNKKHVFCLDNKASLRLLFDYKWGSYSCNKLYKRELFNNISFPVNKNFEDIYTTYKLLKKAKKCCFDTRSYYYYLQRKNSITLDFSTKKMVDEINAYVELYNDKIFYEFKEQIQLIIFNSLIKYSTVNKKIIKKDKDTQKLIRKWFRKYCSNEDFQKKNRKKLLLYKHFNWVYVLRYKISSNASPLYGFIKKLLKN